MTKKNKERAEKLFEKLAAIAPCRKCVNEACEECRWTTFAADRFHSRWDFFCDDPNSSDRMMCER